MKELLTEFQTILESKSLAEKKIWWEKYLHNVIQFRGIAIPVVRECLVEWYKKKQLNLLSEEKLFELATEFLKCEPAEDKMTGILLVELFLLKPENYKKIVDLTEILLDNKFIWDWNTNDWLCVRWLTPIVSDMTSEFVDRIIAWCNADYLWKARCSVVPFAQAKHKFEMIEKIETAIEVVIQRKEKFAKTGVGWVLREISKFDVGYVSNFIEKNIVHFTAESLKNAMKYSEQTKRKNYLNLMYKAQEKLQKQEATNVEIKEKK